MSRHLQYLNCLRAKLRARYGEDDDAVREVESAIKALEEVEERVRASPVFASAAVQRQRSRSIVTDRPLQ